MTRVRPIQIEPRFNGLPDLALGGYVGEVLSSFLGRPSSEVILRRPLQVGEPCVVMGWKVSETERTRVAGGAIHSADGELLAIAKHTLVTTSWGVPMGLNSWR